MSYILVSQTHWRFVFPKFGNIFLQIKLLSIQNIFYLGNLSMAHLSVNISISATRIFFKMFLLSASWQGHLLYQSGHVSHWYLRKCLGSKFPLRKTLCLQTALLQVVYFWRTQKQYTFYSLYLCGLYSLTGQAHQKKKTFKESAEPVRCGTSSTFQGRCVN